MDAFITAAAYLHDVNPDATRALLANNDVVHDVRDAVIAAALAAHEAHA